MRDSKVSEVQGDGMNADEDFVGFGRRDWGGVFGYAGGAGDGGEAVGDVFLVHVVLTAAESE